MHVSTVLYISFYNLFQRREQSLVSGKVPEDHHHQFLRHLIVNENTSVRVGIELEFGGVR